MYRTYINLFRVKPEITTLGTGSKVIRLPRELWLTVDALTITLATLPLTRFLIAPIVALLLNTKSFGPSLYNFLNWIIAIVISFLASLLLRKYEPEGKSVVRWVWDYFKFISRPKWSDGWTYSTKKQPESTYEMKVDVLMVQTNMCSFPAEGIVEQFALYAPANIKMKRKKLVFRSGKKYEPGVYMVKDKKIILTAQLPKKGGVK